MAEITYSRDFLKSVESIPKLVQKKLVGLLDILKKNPFHSILHVKPLVGKLKGFYSFRITRDWRIIFNFSDSQKIFLIDVAHRKDIYK
ncbi:type II toxin-antitoxin system mRNA interferase toxin, RelE/StbE family [Candidatus Wolfebacteria bacterium]|nr:type II toxin-antitoxin system mRNA interferase toxin, RelE/StbE family [Candidatus Wolfebacteria bacterium]